MDRETIYQLALSTGCIDPDLSDPDNWVTDYGGCEDCLTKFAQLVAAHEREACAKLAIEVMDKQGTWGHRQLACEEVASRIRLRK